MANAYALQMRRGTSTDVDNFVSLQGELFLDTTNDFVYLGTSSTVAGSGIPATSGKYLIIQDGMASSAVGSTTKARIFVDSADGDLKIIFADGVTKTISADT